MWSIAWLHIPRGADFPKGGFSKILRQNLRIKMIVDVAKKNQRKNPCQENPCSRVALALAAACIQHTLIAMQPVFRLFVCALLGWIKISCWALVNFTSKIAKCVSVKEKNIWLWSSLPHARAMSPICCLSRTPAKY